MDATLASPPVYRADLFAPDALRAPFEHDRALRELGPVSRLIEPDVYVLSRYDEVREALRSRDALISRRFIDQMKVRLTSGCRLNLRGV